MRTDSLIVSVISIVFALGIVGGVYYAFLQGQKKPTRPSAVQPPPATATEQSRKSTTQPATGRTATPIECKKADGSVFWTNAARCADADLDNRLSIADPVKPVSRIKNKKATHNSSSVALPKIKTLKPITNELSIPCRYSIGMARKIETRSLNLKDDPSESIWKTSYCGWVCEARVENCGNLEEYLRLENLCPWQPFISKRACRN